MKNLSLFATFIFCLNLSISNANAQYVEATATSLADNAALITSTTNYNATVAEASSQVNTLQTAQSAVVAAPAAVVKTVTGTTAATASFVDNQANLATVGATYTAPAASSF